ncbi:DIS3-like exonuclease 1 [Araneus ventricosus]|uniref:DIS3-like exonuclease 1 n=1 Tax=Araneus ventricosus TaxID=182803 RepID=A0A4Y2E9B4_ARAVE|nr:DIS3-like exonuclease 1 [Araneus ventricosus]
MLTQTIKLVKLKGKTGAIVREHYLRDDIPCYSPLCRNCSSKNIGSKNIQLAEDATHYAIPCYDIVQNYLELLEFQELKGLIILQSIASKVIQSSGHRTFNRLLNICKDIRRGSIIFLNENCQKSYVPRKISESLEEWFNKLGSENELGRSGLMVMSQPWGWRVPGPKFDSTQDPSCIGPVAH